MFSFFFNFLQSLMQTVKWFAALKYKIIYETKIVLRDTPDLKLCANLHGFRSVALLERKTRMLNGTEMNR